MARYDLSVIIASRHEEFLGHTIADILKNRRGKTEIICIVDGEWPIAPIPDHPDLTMVHQPVSIGQRAAVNLGARMSNSTFIMKSDAHVAFDEGFDVKLMEHCEYDWTVVPRLYNLHVFNWRCTHCGVETYQGPDLTHCTSCDKDAPHEKVIVWQPRWSRVTDSMRFDKELHFQYWRDFHPQEGIAALLYCQGTEWTNRLLADLPATDSAFESNAQEYVSKYEALPPTERYEHRKTAIGLLASIRERFGKDDVKRFLGILSNAQGDVVDTMSLLGACWFLHRERYWDLDGLDEDHGSWGAMGTELACKAHLSNGRLVCRKNTFYSHLFRTASGFSFPYNISTAQQDHARAHSKNIWRNGLWPKAVHPLSWLTEKFAPIPDWHNV